MDSDQALPQKRWLSTKEAAHYLGVTRTTLLNYTKIRGKGRPPHYRFANKTHGPLRFPREEFIAWANNGSNKQG